jgi:predicted dehydrogenase
MEFSSGASSALVVGAGSIGAHLSRSLSKAGWFVTVIDTSKVALDRFVEDLYPRRYGQLPNNVRAALSGDLAPEQTFDALLVGTPPDTHISVLREHGFRATGIVSIQKPLTTFRKSEIRELENLATSSTATFLAGFNHRVSLGALAFWSLVGGLFSGQKVSIEVNWLENWEGVMKAHPWLRSPGDTYLGFTSRGGGSLFEHAHGLDLGLLACELLDLGPITKFSSSAVLVSEESLNYDQEVQIKAEYPNGSSLVCRQDVVTWPAKKEMKITSDNWSAVLAVGSPETVIVSSAQGAVEFQCTYSKSREEDFDAEVRQFGLLVGEARPMETMSGLSHGLRTSKISSLVARESLGFDQDTFTREELSQEGILDEKVL